MLAQLGVSAGPRFFDLANLPVDFFERLFQRLDQLVDGLLPLLQIAFRRRLKLFQRGAREVEEFLVVVFQSIARKRLEFFGKLFRDALERFRSLLCCAPFAFKF